MMDPAKLKVVELRAELSKRGLDTKGNKPVLVERLRKALEEDTEDPVEEEVAKVDSGDEKAVETSEKDAREKTPERTTPSKAGGGRTSRGAASTTPTKVTPVRGSPKIILTPISDKRISPASSPIIEKTENTGETIPTAREEEKIDEKQAATEESREATSVGNVETISEDTPIVESLATNVSDDVVEKIQTEAVASPAREIEEQASLEKNDTIEASREKEEEICPTDTEMVSDDANDKKPAMHEKLTQEESLPEETRVVAQPEIAYDDTSEREETKAEADDRDFAETMDARSDLEDHEVDVKMEENDDIEDSPNVEETRETKIDVASREEIDEKPKIDDNLQPDEQLRDAEIKDVKFEPEDESERDTKDPDRKDRKDRKRKRSSSPQEEKTKSPPPSHPNDEPELNETDVVLSWYDSDLNLLIDKENFLSATAMHSDGFGYIWAGARASYGFNDGKVYYEAKITDYCDVNLQDEQSPHVLRVGWSVQGTSMQLGEEPLTYGYGGTGKISSANRFSDYGMAFGKNDIVGCYLNFVDDNDSAIISYTINGNDMGPAFTVSKNELDGKALYPHVLTKNCTFACNFGQDKAWSEKILDDYAPCGAVDLKNRVRGPRRPERKEECEIIMMCGLPAAGKTVWATKYASNNPDKMYNVLGTNSLIEKMKVVGLPRRRNYPGRWEVLIDKCTRCLNKLLEMASTRRRNYILDQTNVYPSAQRRKMRNFYGYQRRAVVLVPTDEELKSRTAKRTVSEGAIVPDSAILEMKANFGAPAVGETFDIVEWIELPEEEAKKMIEKYNKEGKEAGYGQQQASKRPRFERTDNHRESRDSRQSSRDSRDSRDHRDRRTNYPDRNRSSTWRGGSNSSGWRDRQPRPPVGHVRHGGGSSSSSGGYGGPSGGGWRGRGGSSSGGGAPSSYRPSTDRRAVSGHDRRTSGTDRNRSVSTRPGGWGGGSMSGYQNSQQPSGGWGGSSQTSNWQQGSQSQQQSNWGAQSSGWGGQQQQQQQWGNWKGYGQGNNYSQGNYSQQGYGNGNWGGWNQQYYNQYWGQQEPTGQTSAAGSQAGNTSSGTPAGNSTSSAGSAYSGYSPGWQGYAQSYGYSAESSNTHTQK